MHPFERAIAKLGSMNTALAERIDQTLQRQCLLSLFTCEPRAREVAQQLNCGLEVDNDLVVHHVVQTAREVSQLLPEVADVLGQRLETGEVFRVEVQPHLIRVNVCRVDGSFPLEFVREVCSRRPQGFKGLPDGTGALGEVA